MQSSMARRLFESDVISDGTQTSQLRINRAAPFESDVISDGTQTTLSAKKISEGFESDVISDGTQTRNGTCSR